MADEDSSVAEARKEFTAYCVRRLGGTGPRAEAAVAEATRKYAAALTALRRFGNKHQRFWDALDVSAAPLGPESPQKLVSCTDKAQALSHVVCTLFLSNL